jgi:Family of unknown function (DUF6781)
MELHMSDPTRYRSEPILPASSDAIASAIPEPISQTIPDPTPSAATAPFQPAAEAVHAKSDDQVIRERVKGLTTEALKGRIDTGAVRDVVSAMIGQTPTSPARDPESRENLAASVRLLDEALVTSAAATHAALQQLASRGRDFTDNDLKDALAALNRLQEDYTAAANRITDVMSGNLRREITELAARAQNVGVEASTRVASMLGEFANSLGAAPGLATIRDAGVRMAMLASGVLAGVADALNEQTGRKS